MERMTQEEITAKLRELGAMQTNQDELVLPRELPPSRKRVLVAPSEGDKATSAILTAEFTPSTLKAVGYEASTGNKVYKDGKNTFKLDSNGNAVSVNEKPASKVSVDAIVGGAKNMTDLQTVMADQPELVKPFMYTLLKGTQGINQQYQGKFPSYQELSRPMFDNSTIRDTTIIEDISRIKPTDVLKKVYNPSNIIPGYAPYDIIKSVIKGA